MMEHTRTNRIEAKNILTLDHKGALDFFMTSEQYHGFELPEYFTFNEILKFVRDTVANTPYEECLQEGISPEELTDVNLDILLNKDGRYAVRPIMLANPYLYYFLVREVCCEENWTIVKGLFDKFKVPHITSCAIPIIPNEKEAFHKATTINNWWNSMEQRSIELSLQQVLERLNFRMNSQKTKISDSIVTDAVKSDKLAYIYNTPIFNKKGVDFDSFEKHLLYILMFSRQYPDSGSVRTMLSDIDKRIEDHLKSLDEKNTSKAEKWESFDFGEETEPAKTKGIFSELKTYNPPKYIPGGSIRALSAVCTQIALENVGCAHYALRVISRMIDSLTDMDEKRSIIDLVYNKLCNQPNSSYNQLWLQNMTYTQDKKQGTSPYTLRLCQLVAGKVVEPLWNTDWLKPELTTDLPYDSVVDGETLKKVTPVITFRETRRYEEEIY